MDSLDRSVSNAAKEALDEKSSFWAGVEWFINFLRTKVKTFFTEQIKSLPIVGTWAARIGSTVTEFIFTVLGTFVSFFKIICGSHKVWQHAHLVAMTAWEANADNGLLAQIYVYGKKMAGYFLEIIKQCFERAIQAHGLEMDQAQKEDISKLLDSLLQ
ncbi:unnamed protein product [Didymodactylos carnosus]|uniref:Uncharacterized protein n=1 Tax=Didymodactylos carnosus TaxID=1234261 RepID=A0A815UVL7_9BILA|nr:unnamed protein product [Didymodactylos carnosus]CAF1525049.1 unnamed protein product [Didymodactylos carnosus]CAF3826113.1 unnamed protein product [Didymodactylos carnosus]CAF4384099.1 unnamed protein product [Didymodactylos carnosus]